METMGVKIIKTIHCDDNGHYTVGLEAELSDDAVESDAEEVAEIMLKALQRGFDAQAADAVKLN